MMDDTFIFDLQYRNQEHRPSFVLAVFLPNPRTTESDLRDVLQGYLDVEERVPPDIILLMGTKGLFDLLNKLAQSNLLIESIPKFTRMSDPPPIRAICLDDDGQMVPVTTSSATFTDSAFVSAMRHEGLLKVFKDNDQTVVESVGTLHYIKPSGEHASKFIRTANALVHFSDTNFVAFCLLPYLTEDVEFVYTDTAGINGLVLATALLKLQNNPGWTVPVVDSFSSYSGLDRYDFKSATNALFVVSASTSGRLAKRLRAKLSVSSAKIVTVYYLSNEPCEDSAVLCDVTRVVSAPKIEFPKACSLCSANVPAIAIDGDQFLLGHIPVRAYLIRKNNIPEWLTRFMQDFYGRGVVGVHRLAAPADERPRELYIDLERILVADDEDFQHTVLLQELDRLLNHCVPATLEHLVHVDDPGSKALADRIKLHVEHCSPGRQFSVYSLSQLPIDFVGSDLSQGTLLMVAGIVVTGQKLMTANQLLRNRPDDGVIYLAGLTRTRDKSRLQEILSNIQFRKEGSGHPFHSALDIYIPEDQLSRPSPWDVETNSLRTLRDLQLGAGELDEEVYKWSLRRCEYLENGRVAGLTNDLFLPKIDGTPLDLRQGFAFWGFEYTDTGNRRPSQADTYFTVASVLHRWRDDHQRRVGDIRLPYEKIVISPRNFYRYNDGIIQASLLRAAYRGELDYRMDEHLSASMGEVLESVFCNFDNSRGEATLEFLLALFERRLTLQNLHIERSVDGLEKRLHATGLWVKIAQQFATRILEDLE